MLYCAIAIALTHPVALHPMKQISLLATHLGLMIIKVALLFQVHGVLLLQVP